MTHEHFDATALMALPSVKAGAQEERGFLIQSRPFLISQIRQRGVDVGVTRGAPAIDEVEGIAKDVVVPRYLPEGLVLLDRLGDQSLADFNVIRNIVAPKNIDGFLPQLNPYALRMLGRNKSAAASELLAPAGGYDRQATFLKAEDDASTVHDRIASLPGDLVVAKPNSGMQSRGIIVGTKSEVERALQSRSADCLVEEKLDFSAPLPDIKAANESEQARLDEANAKGVNKELRTYYFGNGVWDGVLRVADEGAVDLSADEWLYIDLDTIPAELLEKGNKIIESIDRRFQTSEVNIAFDWAYASSASNPEPHWQIMEMNAGEAQLVTLTEDHDTGSRHHIKLATQIARIAVS